MASLGLFGHGAARRGSAGEVRCVKDRQVKAWSGEAGKASPGQGGRGELRLGMAGAVSLVGAWWVRVRFGLAGGARYGE